MLNAIIRASIVNRLLVVLGLLGLVIAGLMLLPRLALDAFPDVTNVQVVVNTQAKGLAAAEVEQLITYPVEAAMYGLKGVEAVRSTSMTGLSVVTVVFKESTNIDFARQQVFQQLQAAKEDIPKEAGTPEIGPNTSGLGEVLYYTLYSATPGQYDQMALRSVNDWIVKPLLKPSEGVVDVLSFGGSVRQYQVNIDPSKLIAYQLSVKDVEEALTRNNRNAGGWYQDRGAEQLVIRGEGWMRSGAQGLEDVGATPVKEADGVVVRVRDLGQIVLGGEIRQGATMLSLRDKAGRPKQMGEVVTGVVLKRIGANTNATIKAVQERLPLVQKALPPGVRLKVVYDQSSLVQKAVGTVSKALIESFVLIVIVLIAFLMNLRAAFLVLLSVPVSILAALIAMALFGVSANLMSLGGLAIAIGMMVDGSVVMMENIFARLTGKNNLDWRERIDLAAREVAQPVFFAVLIIIIVFAPLFSLEGVEGKMFQPMALSIVFGLLASLLVALVVIPALASYLFRGPVVHRESPVLRPVERFYRRVLLWIRGRQKLVLGSAVGGLIFSLALLPFLGTEFVPELKEGTMSVRATLAPSASLKTSLEMAPKIAATLMKFPEVTYALSRTGRAEVGGDPEQVNNTEILVGLKPENTWTSTKTLEGLREKMQEALSVYPGVQFSFSQPIATRVDELLSGVKADLAIKLIGPDLAVLEKKGREIEALTAKIRGASDVAMEQIAGEAQLSVKPNRDVLSRYGLSVADVMEVVENAIGGTAAGQIINGNERYDIYVRLAEPFRGSPEAIRDLILRAPGGALLRLGDAAKVEIVSGPPQIRRDDVQRRVVIQANVEGRDMGGLVEELQAKIASEVKLPPGYTVVFGGQFENQKRAEAKLMVVVPVSLGLIFLLLYFAFGSAGQAGLIMLNVPLAMIGGIVALFVSGTYLSVPGSIGFIALFGVAVLNGVVLVSAINRNIADGMELLEAIEAGALSRLRPVLMTAAIAGLGLVPLLLSSGVGAEVQRPLATVVIGGLITSTLLTLVVLPCAYAWASRRILAK
ncbi:cobalt-zinc-cadmium resistance protein CzcA [Rhizomicrobium palustre]|uniref:Cobalt-zinc-cadmium resistance protein CzcA n=1 Tax=Rhizomicrobium palustre TaxID=189966 RepID=A0A846MZM4_9PROT|nr:CusA/CzcA family heavy metal efflux RND transporter [Rhizomicrobium palustre]NIK88763.1 cobalt-zinc-cadmium resistance protein CzcA [Rhizomicrobium palustre]